MSEGGYIYAIGMEGLPSVKIGKTAGPITKRLTALQIGQPAPLTVLAAVPVEQDLSRIEKAIHHFLAADRQRGEWRSIRPCKPCARSAISATKQRVRRKDILCRLPQR